MLCLALIEGEEFEHFNMEWEGTEIILGGQEHVEDMDDVEASSDTRLRFEEELKLLRRNLINWLGLLENRDSEEGEEEEKSSEEVVLMTDCGGMTDSILNRRSKNDGEPGIFSKLAGKGW